MTLNQTSNWNRCQEQDNILPISSPRLELVPDKASASEISQTELHGCDSALSYRKLYDESPSINFTLNESGIVLSLNRFGANLLGYNKDELLHKPIFELFASSEHENLASLISSLFKVSGAKLNSCECRLNCPNSKIVWVKATARILPLSAPVVLMVCEDITRQKHLEDAYCESEQRFKTIANTAPVMLWMASSNGMYNFFNEFWSEFTGRSPEQGYGIGWLENVHVDDKIECLQTYYSAFNSKTKFSMEYRLQRADGEYRWVSDTGIPRFTNTGEFAGYIGCCVDINEHKSIEFLLLQSEKEKQLQISEKEKLNRLKDEFLSTVSHELRTPLTNMKMAIQMLGIALNIGIDSSQGSQNTIQHKESKAARYFQILNNECEREINLINNFLDLQKLDINSKPLVLETIYIQEWLVKVVELFKARNRKASNLYVDNASDLPQLVSDPFSLERILIELLTNACKFSPQGKEIIVSARNKSTYVEFLVTNTGVEIPASELPYIFDKFYRIPSNDPWKQGGTGLGLALVQKLTKCLGGTIEVESKSNRTRFSVQLPWQRM
ncbi:two-component sensor histidine kinase [Calothrix sp. NIES-4071]|nr:two-component sensor histidine kinase [Calothrix sp. NIES-4071]BAZ62719.1 two-component sensor histidine kinase [Calothrix sp. NIES-4105]